jgi:hypothetical protein
MHEPLKVVTSSVCLLISHNVAECGGNVAQMLESSEPSNPVYHRKRPLQHSYGKAIGMIAK